jgi:carboxyl-terminal processing protease
VPRSPATTSAAEDFLAAADAMPHATTIRQPTNDGTGQPLFLELPGGGAARVRDRAQSRRR